jgi:hypothetical protein
VFVRGVDNRLWQSFSVNGGLTWTGWFQPVGNDGILASGPAVTSWGAGRLDVFVMGVDGVVYQRFYQSGWNNGWLPLGRPGPGSLGELTCASWGDNRIDLFVTGTDHRLYQTFWQDTAWSGWLRPPGTEAGLLTSAPGAASWGLEQVAVFGRGTDGGLWWSNYTGGPSWSSWARLGQLGDTFQDKPSATSRGDQQLDVFVRGDDNLCYQYYFGQ